MERTKKFGEDVFLTLSNTEYSTAFRRNFWIPEGEFEQLKQGTWGRSIFSVQYQFGAPWDRF